jgi:hypothetical protein
MILLEYPYQKPSSFPRMQEYSTSEVPIVVPPPEADPEAETNGIQSNHAFGPDCR